MYIISNKRNSFFPVQKCYYGYLPQMCSKKMRFMPLRVDHEATTQYVTMKSIIEPGCNRAQTVSRISMQSLFNAVLLVPYSSQSRVAASNPTASTLRIYRRCDERRSAARPR